MGVYSIQEYIKLLSDEGLLVDTTNVVKSNLIEHITYDSREVKNREMAKNTLFICKGVTFKSEYFRDVVNAGITCYVSEREYQTECNVGAIIVKDERKAIAAIACKFHENAFDKLKLVGITGTKGKSTTAYFVKYIFDDYLQEKGAMPSGIISSIDVFDGVVKKESHFTTPEAFELHQHFHNAVKSGIEFFEMEVSSLAIRNDRVRGVNFDIGVFLNISEDHISPIEHSDLEDYFSSKLKLFKQSKVAIVNLNSDFSERILEEAKSSERIVTFGLDPKADIYGYNIQKRGTEIHFNVRTASFDDEFILTMPGLFNIENALAAIGVCMTFEIPLNHIKEGLRKSRSSGRMEIYHTDDMSKIAIVDYAHNKLSFTKLYQSIVEEYKGREIITVFGCPGGKSLNRRVELGELSGRYSDKVYLTAEDPGYEEVGNISADIAVHVNKYNCECYCIDDRGEAIEQAILNAAPNSIILITGKGNETRQKIKSEYVPCETDVEYAKRALSKCENLAIKS